MGKFKDLSGQKFGKLTVTSEHYSYKKPCGGTTTKWVCKCDCGNTVDVSTCKLTTGKTVSCGCWKKEKFNEYLKTRNRDLTNQKFGRLTAQYVTEISDRGTVWHCKCDCGNELDILGTSLTKGNTKSCGCYQKYVATYLSPDKRRKQNKYELFEDYGIGHLYNGLSFIFDVEDYEKIKDMYWGVNPEKYVYSNYHNQKYLLHRFVMNCPEGLFVDHINHNPLDNRKTNLRICTNQENSFNMAIDNKNGYKGIVKLDKKYGARVIKDGIVHYLGRFDTPEEAALAYNEKAKELFGEFAYLNNIPCQEQGATENVVT